MMSVDGPKASVVMASNSSVDDVAPALEALLSQTYRNLEIVFVLDRPADEAEQDGFRSRYPGVVFEFLGAVHRLPTALNAGIRRATGTVIVRCDDDDICDPARVERQVELLLRDGLDFVCSQAWGKRPGDNDGWLIDCPPDDAAIKAALEERNIIVHSSLVGLKSSFETLGLYNPAFTRAQDYELYLRAIRSGCRFGAVQAPLVTRFYPDTSITVKHRKNQIMFSFAAQVLHAAHKNDMGYLLGKVSHYMSLLMTPNFARALKRRVDLIKKKGR